MPASMRRAYDDVSLMRQGARTRSRGSLATCWAPRSMRSGRVRVSYCQSAFWR